MHHPSYSVFAENMDAPSSHINASATEGKVNVRHIHIMYNIQNDKKVTAAKNKVCMYRNDNGLIKNFQTHLIYSAL